MRVGKILFLFLILISLGFAANSQRNYSALLIDDKYFDAYELFQKKKYGTAQPIFIEIIEELKGFDTEILVNSEYYSALCSVYLFNEDAEHRLYQFINNHPESMKTRNAIWELAKFLYKSKDYRTAIIYFEKVDRIILSPEEKGEFFFKRGYSYFMRKDYEKASQSFYEIKDLDTDYSGPATYYYAYIAYTQENYETALKGFKKLENDDNFKAIVPYYILQILYGQEKYDEIVRMGPQLLENAIPGRKAEVAKFVGDAFYQLDDYSGAKTYLELYKESAKSISREDKYQMGFMYYKLGEFENAIPLFQSMGGKKDELGQNAYYLLADCYLKIGDKAQAGQAFFTASNMEFDDDIREDAMFNYAKITYELAFSPFNETIQAFEKYIELYPHSPKIDEAYQYLVMAFQNTKNYKMALESLEKILNKNDKVKEAYQRIAFYRGLELYNDLKFEEALELFEIALSQGEYEPTLYARCFYWEAETLYRMKDYQAALESYNEFLISPGAYSLGEYKLAHYNIAYCYFDLDKFTDASRWFRKYIDQVKGGKGKIVADAYNRLGDCAFVELDYPLSVTYYQRSLDLGSSDPEYALFQKSFAQGLLKQHMAKINGLTQLLRDYPKSNYVDDALFERGRSYVKIEKPNNALEDFYSILDRFPNSSYYSKSLLEIGLVYYNQGKNQEAIEAYKSAVKKFPGSPEARSALTGMKTVYVEMNDVETYFAYVRTLGSFANVSVSEQDSLTYLTGENLYMAGNCERALQVLGNYLQKFPEGSFVLNAHFYRAECLASSGRIDEALADYTYVASQSKNVFSEPSLLATSGINFDEGNYANALENYVLLENVADISSNKLIALMGQIRSLFLLNDYQGVVKTGQRIFNAENVSEVDLREVNFKMGKSYLIIGDLDASLNYFKKISGEIKSKEGAEAKYRVADIYFKDDKIDQAEKEVREFIDMNTPHQEWMARVFILSADISLLKKDYFQARYTLQSLLDYYGVEDDGIKQEAKQKLEHILELEESEGDTELNVSDTLSVIFHRKEYNNTIANIG